MDRYDDKEFRTPQYLAGSAHATGDPYGRGPAAVHQAQDGRFWDGKLVGATLSHEDLEKELARMISAESGERPPLGSDGQPASRIDRRRVRPKSPFHSAYERITQVTVLFAVITVGVACMLAWSITYTYRQLCTVAASVLPVNVAHFWPLAVYGPWFVAALSILRATAQRQPANRSWCVLLATSATAVALCVSNSSHSVLAFVTLGVPPVTSLVCFWEFVGQFSAKHRTAKGAHAQRRSQP
ncbi:DUF2637 domain-containing protein [Streptomyces sp. NPDC096057]|uniref:DUF2637 domain-containing protein n=1 Tax=Streptomyces sp. NPDC096057 TaxID=3155543 RepID=UPI003325F1BB